MSAAVDIRAGMEAISASDPGDPARRRRPAAWLRATAPAAGQRMSPAAAPLADASASALPAAAPGPDAAPEPAAARESAATPGSAAGQGAAQAGAGGSRLTAALAAVAALTSGTAAGGRAADARPWRALALAVPLLALVVAVQMLVLLGGARAWPQLGSLISAAAPPRLAPGAELPGARSLAGAGANAAAAPRTAQSLPGTTGSVAAPREAAPALPVASGRGPAAPPARPDTPPGPDRGSAGQIASAAVRAAMLSGPEPMGGGVLGGAWPPVQGATATTGAAGVAGAAVTAAPGPRPRARPWHEHAATAAAPPASPGAARVQASASPSSASPSSASPPVARGAEWLRAQDVERFTLQLVSVTDDARLARFASQLRGTPDVARIRVSKQGALRHVIVQGAHARRADAQRMADELAGQLGVKPWIRRIGDVLAELR